MKKDGRKLYRIYEVYYVFQLLLGKVEFPSVAAKFRLWSNLTQFWVNRNNPGKLEKSTKLASFGEFKNNSKYID